MILNWFKKLFKKPDAAHHDLWDHIHWPNDDDDFKIPEPDLSTNEVYERELAKIIKRQKREHPELWNEFKVTTRRKKVPHPHKGKRKGRRKVGSHIRRARHKRKHAKR